MEAKMIPYQEGMDVGVGIDSPTGAAMGAAATGSPSSVGGGELLDYSLQVVSTEEELQTALGISASASGGVGLFGASARMDFSKKCAVNSSSVFALVSVQITESFQSIKSPGIDPAAASLLASGNEQRFGEQYGDKFVRGIKYGGVFFGMIEITTQSKTDQESVSVAVQGSYSAFSASGQFSQSFQDSVKNRGVSVKLHVEGGTLPSPLPTSVDGLMSAAGEWVRTVKNNPWAYSVLIDSYNVLPLPAPPNFADLQHQLDVLTQCALWRNMDLQTLNDIAYIKSNPEQFTDLNLDQLTQRENDISADLNTIAAAASNAINKPKEAAHPKLIVPPPLALPSRVKSLVVIPSVPIPNVVGLEKDDAAKVIVGAGLTCTLNFDPPKADKFRDVSPMSAMWLIAQPNHVWAISSGPGASVSKGSLVTLYVKEYRSS